MINSKMTYMPTQMPMFAGSPGFPNISRKTRIIYACVWLVLGLSSGILSNMIPANISDFKVYFNLDELEGAVLLGIYYMFSAWASLFLFKFRQHFGINGLIRFIIIFLIISILLRFFHLNFQVELIIRAILGFVCTSLSVVSVFYAGQFLPKQKRASMLLLGLGLTQLGYPIDKIISIYLINDWDLFYLFYFELGLSLLCVCVLILAPLPPSFTTYSFSYLNIFSLSLFAISSMCFCLAMNIISALWWDNNTAILLLGFGFLCLFIMILFEWLRKVPLLNVKFLSTGYILKIILIAAFMRIFLTEQNISTGFFTTTLNYSNENLLYLYIWIFLGGLSGFICSYFTMVGFDRYKILVFTSFLLLSLGSYLNSSLSPYSKPSDIYIGQFLISFSAIYFMIPLLLDGVVKSFVRGALYLVSFSAIFSLAQNIFALLGSAFIKYFLVYRTKSYLAELDNTNSNLYASAYAYNDMFLIISILSFVVFLILLIEWFLYKLFKKRPNDREIEVFLKSIKNKAAKEEKLRSKNEI